MDVLRGSLGEFGMLLGTRTGGAPDPDDGPQPERGAPWIAIQVLALAACLPVFVALHAIFRGPPVAGTVATTAAWVLPAGRLALPPAIHWFAGPPRRGLGPAAALVMGVSVGVGFAGMVASLPALWSDLITLTVGAFGAAAVYGIVSPIPARPAAGRALDCGSWMPDDGYGGSRITTATRVLRRSKRGGRRGRRREVRSRLADLERQRRRECVTGQRPGGRS